MSVEAERLRVGLAQIAPVWLDRNATAERVLERIYAAAAEGCDLVVFGEGLLPGYPFWVEHTDGARFESALQQTFYAHYVSQAVQIESGDLQPISDAARDAGIAVYLGIIERPPSRSGNSLYAALVYLDPDGQIRSVHRKLMPTYEERLVWSAGDGHGLRTHRLGGFTLGGLNCWENWMPLPRAALYGQGENVHIAVWPGNARNTEDITRFIARESRSYVISVSGYLTRDQVPESVPEYALLNETLPPVMANGGSCAANPDGSWLLPPQTDTEGLFCVDLDMDTVRRARQSFDPAGHYSRPDVTRLRVDRTRQTTVDLRDQAIEDEYSNGAGPAAAD